jgi:hypothetical protein
MEISNLPVSRSSYLPFPFEQSNTKSNTKKEQKI